MRVISYYLREQTGGYAAAVYDEVAHRGYPVSDEFRQGERWTRCHACPSCSCEHVQAVLRAGEWARVAVNPLALTPAQEELLRVLAWSRSSPVPGTHVPAAVAAELHGLGWIQPVLGGWGWEITETGFLVAFDNGRMTDTGEGFVMRDRPPPGFSQEEVARHPDEPLRRVAQRVYPELSEAHRMHDDVLSPCVREYLEAVLASVSDEADRIAIFNLRPLLRIHPPDANGYFYPPHHRQEPLIAPYSTEPLRGILLGRLDLLRRCEDDFTVSLLRDACGEDVPTIVRQVRVRAWVDREIRTLWEELARVPEANVADDISALLQYAGSVEPDVVEALTEAEAAARALDAPRARARLASARELLHQPGRGDVTLRGIE
jgi:hypothetical protein